MNYTCSKCGGPVAIEGGAVARACGHADSGVVAHCSAACYGEGGIPQRGNAAARLIRRIISALKGGRK